MNTLRIECEHLVAVPTGVKMFQQIIFLPTLQTVENIKIAIRDDNAVKIAVKDAGGDHTSTRLHVPLGFFTEYGTIVLTTREL
jgi:hypothetical protein